MTHVNLRNRRSFLHRQASVRLHNAQQRAALLFRRVKLSLLGRHLRYKFFDPIHGKPIGYRETYALVVLDLSIELHTLFTHGVTAFARWRSKWTAANETSQPKYCFNW